MVSLIRFKTICLFVVFFKNALSANILYIAPVASPSHHIWNRALALGLVENGHNVTMLGHDAEKGSVPNQFTLILLEGIYNTQDITLNLDELINKTPLGGILDMYKWASYCCEYDLKTKGLQRLLNYPNDYKFDLIIFDVTLGQCLYPIIERFNDPPVVAVTPFLLPPVLSNSFGNHLYTSYVPFYTMKSTNKMSFQERFLNFIYVYSEILYRKYMFVPSETILAKKRFGVNIRPLEETERKMTLLLSNTDPIFDYPIALPPNIIPVGGLHVKPPRKLPQELQKVLDESTQGVVLFSLGSNVRSDQLKLDKRNALLEAFSKIPQTILWKFETDDLERLPRNVIISKWLPQNDILGHKNTKLFISHGGALSTQEAMYHGVPVLGIPIFADQRSNIEKMAKKKLALSLDLNNLTLHAVSEALTEMLRNPVYTNNVKDLSKRYRDQPQSPLERAVFWVEYVLRHGTADHLNLIARNMPFYQTANIDIAVVFALGILLFCSFLLLIITSCKFILRKPHCDLKKKPSKQKTK